MAFVMLFFLSFITVLFIGLIPGNETNNFPLNDCAWNRMDILMLLFEEQELGLMTVQIELSDTFLRDLSRIPSNTETPRVMCASVYDTFYNQNPNVDISGWEFASYIKSKDYNTKDEYRKYNNLETLQEVLLSKIRFVVRVFSEMTGVRENATHIAVIFLDCRSYSFDQVRNIPGLVKGYSPEVKIFLVLLGVENLKETIHLGDAFLLYCKVNTVDLHNLLPMAICKLCTESWFVFQHSNSTDMLSCYRMFENRNKRQDWISSMDTCDMLHGSLAGIETQKELIFLQTWFKSFFKERLHFGENFVDDRHYLAHVYIGLHRDLESVAKRFQWSLGKATRKRPLVVNNWMPGQPSSGYNNAACGVWQFVWNGHNNGTNHSSNDDDFVEGWADVACRNKLSNLILCEVIIPRRLDDIHIMRLNPANKESFTKALGRQNFKKFCDNIVSASVHLENNNRVKFVNEQGSQFPVFDCGKDAGYPRYISYFFVCDSINHCINRRDESSCTLKSRCANTCLDATLGSKNEGECEGVRCCDGYCLHERWVNDGEVDCTVCPVGTDDIINDEAKGLSKFSIKNETCVFICNTGQCIHVSHLNDGYNHCNEQNALDETIGTLEQANTCYHILGHRIWAPRCVYIKDIYGAIMGCRDVSHLKDCEDFECPDGYFKCLINYCIPLHYVLDGNIDCPTGEDEQRNIGSCSGNFVCWNSDICLHPDLVCDGHPECPHGDDEMDCDDLCPQGFRCVSRTVSVSDYNRSIPLGELGYIYSDTKYVDLSGVNLSSLLVNYTLENAVTIILSNCEIESFNIIVNSLPRNVHTVDISNNMIQFILLRDVDYHILQNIRHLNISYNKELVLMDNLRFRYLEILDLSHTGLSYINNSFFAGLPKLDHLNLSYTFISDFPHVFSSNLVLQTLDLQGLPIHGFYEDFFNGLTISQHLYTNNFRMCCPQIRGQNIPDYTCHSPDDSISSCFDLVRVPAQRVLLWVVGVLAVLGNMTVIVYRSVWDRSVVGADYGLFVTNLGMSDIIMGLYLLIIAGADYYYRGIYVLFDKNWRESVVCKFAGFMATLSIEASTFFIFLFTLDRFFVMKFPFEHKPFFGICRVIALLWSWIISFLLALIPVVFKFEIYSTNAMCLGLPLTIKSLTGWEYSFGLFIVYNFIMFLIVACGQIIIYRSMSQNEITRSTSTTIYPRPHDIMATKQLSFVALSNFLCWFSVGIMGLLTLSEHEISNDVYTWIMAFVIPINSAVTPLFYIILVIERKWEQFKTGVTSAQ